MAEVLHGTATSGDNLYASANKTQVYGLAGDDTLTADGKSDILLIGGSGNDRLIMTGGNGTLSGGTGADIFELTYSADQKISVVIEDIDPTADKIVVHFAGTDTPQLSSIASGNDVVWTTGNNYFNLTLKSSSDASDYFDGTASDNVWEVLRLTNNERENQGLTGLTLSQALTDGAAIRATEIVNTYSHTRPDGNSCFTAVTKTYWSMGENIYSSPTSPEAAVEGWMNSAGHRANILNENFTKLGVGYTYDANSQWKHHWVQMFGAGLTEPDTLSTAELLSAKIEIDTASTPSTGTSQVISNYTGEPVTVSGFMGATFSGNNFVVNSSAGTLTIQNVTDKIVDLRDGAGNEFVKAYKASAAGVVDGRGINSYEIIEGSSAGMDVIFAGDGGSQLWGGSGTSADAIAGGNGSDIFIGGRYQGADVFYSASSADFVNLTDATLSDIVAAVEVNGNIAIGFNTGNIVTIQSTELLSAAVNLADGSSWRFNHVTKSWQGA